MAGRKKSFIGGVIIDLIGLPLTMLLGIVIVPIYLQYITAQEYGFWCTLLDFLTVVSLLNSGNSFYLVQTMTAEKVRGFNYAKEQISSLFASQLIIILLSALTIWGLYYVFPAFKNSFQNLPGTRSVYKLAGTGLLFGMLAAWFLAVIQGQNKMIRYKLITLVQKTSFQLLPILFLVLGYGLGSFSLSFFLTRIFPFILLVLLTFNYCRLRISLFSVTIESLKSIMSFCSRMFIGGSSYYVRNFTDTLIIASFSTTTNVTIYVLTMKLSNFLKFITARIIGVGYTGITELLVEKDYQKLQYVIQKLFRISLRIGLFTSASILVLNEVFVSNWVGSKMYGGIWLTIFASIICLKESIYPVFKNIVFSTKEIKTLSNILFLEAALNVILSLLFLPLFGITGVALATVLSSTVISPFYGFWKACKIAGLKLTSFNSSVIWVVLKSVPSIAVLYVGNILISESFSWILFFTVLVIAGFLNVVFFDAVTFIKNLGKPPKELLNKLIDNA